MYGDIPMEIYVDLDQVMMTLDEVLQLRQGSVIKMNSSAGDNINISIGGALIGYGEIVVIELAMGVRITGFDMENRT